jgi:predicted small lipoprotein YifL
LVHRRTAMSRALLFLVVALFVQACGTRGALYLPPPETPDEAGAQQKRR